MDTYTLLRAFADSWFLIAMFSFFVGAAIWAFWPSQRDARQNAAEIPFRDDKPLCTKTCANCACKSERLELTNV